MIERISLRNFGPLVDLDWSGLGAINLVIGPNGAGKTFLLKALYTAMRTVETHGRGDDPRSLAEVLFDKLYWTFQADRLGDIVTRGAASALECKLVLDGATFGYSFGRTTTKQISTVHSDIPARAANSVFLPAKEVLSLQSVVIASRERDKVFGFDDTYYDLCKALQLPTMAGKNFKVFADARARLEAILGGRVTFDAATGEWRFKQGAHTFQVGAMAEGAKKISLLDTLLGNRYLTPSSVVFLDEPESALHPQAIVGLLDIVAALAALGVQFVIASHSYIVVKKLYLLALERKLSLPVLSLDVAGAQFGDLRDGMVDNAIIDASVALYAQEVELSLR